MEVNDEAAEREHCARVANQFVGHAPRAEFVLMRERAAVRAPLQAQVQELQQALTNQYNHGNAIDRANTNLIAELRKQVQELEQAIEHAWAPVCQQQEAKLSEVQAAVKQLEIGLDVKDARICALQAEITELKRQRSAAEPMDEAAERARCFRAVKALGWFDEARQIEQLRSFTTLLVRERAAAHAAGWYEGNRYATAEIERLTRERDAMAFERDTHMEASQERAATFHTNGVQSLNKQLTEAQAEIERLKAVQTTQSLRIDLIRILAEKWKGRIYPASWAQAASELEGELRAEVLTGEPSRANSGLLTQACIEMQVKLGKLKDETEWLRQRCIALENGNDEAAENFRRIANELQSELGRVLRENVELRKQVQELEQEVDRARYATRRAVERAEAVEKQVQELQQEIADRDRWDDDDGRIYPEDPK